MMKNLSKWASLALAFLLYSCGILLPSESPRVSTPEERAQAHSLVTAGETLLNAAAIAGAVNNAQLEAGRRTIAELRDAIDASEAKPVLWGDMLLRAVNISTAWLVPPPKAAPSG